MKCFYHPSSDAVAICKSCNRGLCPGCVVEVGLGSSCRNRCEVDVAILNELVQRGRTAYKKTSASYLRSGIFMMLIGSTFLVIGVRGLVEGVGGMAVYFPLSGGFLFGCWGVSYLFSARQINQK